MALFRTVFCLLVTSLGSFAALANTITVNVDFIKRPAFTGVVYIEDKTATTTQINLDQKNKQFTQKVVVGTPGSEVIFNNTDQLEHNIFANDIKSNVNFDIGLMPPGDKKSIKIDWSTDSIVRIGCKIHPRMRSYIANVNSQHIHQFEFDKKVKQYQAVFNQVSGNENEIKLLMPSYDLINLTIQPGETKTVEFKKKNKTRGTLTVTSAAQ